MSILMADERKKEGWKERKKERMNE